ncbi:MAG TPA: histidine phosphatase family protein [Acidimicrobiales bacterium]|nr:MAG: phosphoglycerate mutase [Actinobacteria bacterium 21-73-9]HQU26042.1 histidine phosphatase family protein [Acidimicrobiales bacterium]
MARPTTFVLVRHGATSTTGQVLPGRAPGLHLSEAGRAQAEAAAAAIARMRPRPRALYVSPLERAKETAAPIATALSLRAGVERGLNECDFGAWTGQRLTSLARRAEWRTVQHAPSSFRFPEGESFAEMQLRVWSTLERLAARHRGQSVVCVSHADPIKAAVTFALGVPLDLFQRTVVSPASLSVVTLSGAGPVVLCVNAGTLDRLGPS